MRILFIAPRFHSNQVDLVQKLIEEGHDVQFFVIGKGASESYEDIEPTLIPLSAFTKWYIKHQGIEGDVAKYYPKALPKIGKFIGMVKKYSPDVIILRSASGPIYSKLAIIYAQLKKVKIVFYTQGPKYVRGISRGRRLHDWFFCKCLKARWYTPVLFRGEKKLDDIDLTDVDYIPFFRKCRDLPDNRFSVPEVVNILCVAKYEPRKNIALLIDVAERIIQRNSKFTLTVIGTTNDSLREDYYREIKGRVRDLGLEKNILLLKNIPHTQMSDYYLSNQLLILPSVRESASVAQVEAMSYGLAIICSKDNGSAHYVQNGKSGFVVDANVDNIFHALFQYIDSPQLLVEHGREGYRAMQNELSINKSYNALLRLIR
jgi:glycosyltransferase involved in cell wall biosynthesis